MLLLRDEVEVEPEVLQHVAQIGSLPLMVEECGVTAVQHRMEAISHLAHLLKGGILEIGMEFEFVFHGSTLPLSGLTLHSVEARFQCFDDSVLEPNHLVVLLTAEIDPDIFPHPFANDTKTFEDELQLRAIEFVHDLVIPRSGLSLHRILEADDFPYDHPGDGEPHP